MYKKCADKYCFYFCIGKYAVIYSVRVERLEGWLFKDLLPGT